MDGLQADISNAITAVEQRSAKREPIHQSLTDWHHDFQPIQAEDDDSAYDRIANSEIPWGAHSAHRQDVRRAAQQRFEELRTDAAAYQRQIADLQTALEAAEMSAKMEDQKVDKLKRALFEHESRHKNLEKEAKDVEAQSMLAAEDVTSAKSEASKAVANTVQESQQLLQVEKEEKAKLAELQARLEVERDSLAKEHDGRLKSEHDRLALENKAAAAKVAAAEQRRLVAHSAAVEERAHFLNRKGREEAERLAREIAGMESRIAEVMQSTEKTDAKIMAFEAQVQRDRGVRAEMEARVQQQRELDEQDPDFVREQKQFEWWLENVFRVQRVDMAMQVDEGAILAERFRQRRRFA
eukprot:SAG31_NODE_3001_length_4799_cov_3.189362_1_plen_354_part_00